jgi:PAS domain S-box-containing protein
MAGELRRRAEKIARRKVPEDLQALPPAAAQKLLHERRVHQIELEVQNEELRTAQEKLEESRGQYFELYDVAPVGYFSISEKGVILEANLTGANLLGVVPRDLRAQRFSHFIYKEDLDNYYLHRRQLFKTRSPQLCETRMVRKDGSLFWARVEATLAQDGKSGKPVCLATMSDVSLKKRAEEALQVERDRAQQYLDIAGVILVCLAPDQTITLINRKGCELLGYSQKELIGKNWFDTVLPEDERQKVKAVFAQLIKGELEPVEHVENYVATRSGDKRLISWHNTLVRDAAGNINGTLSSGQDITDRKRLEEEQQRVEKLESVGLLAGGIAHDFNNILTAILGNINLARMEAAPNSEIQKILEETEKASLRAKDLAGQLLTFSRAAPPIKKLASLAELLRDSSDSALRGSNVKCRLSIPADLWHAEIDAVQVSQIIHNLVINARQAMPGGGTIAITADNMALSDTQSLGRRLPIKEGDFIRISIADHGGGIPAEHLDKIFDPFSITGQKGGGLGLATAFSIARQHGGHLSVESKPGAGSTFYLYLPAFPQTSTLKQDKKEAIKPVGKARILVMDDEKAVRTVAGRMLKHLGYEDVEFASDGAEAVRMYKAALESGNPFSVAILDLTVHGGMGGDVAVSKLLKIDPGVKAIVSSGYTDESVIVRYSEYGFSGMVAKPYTLEELGKALLITHCLRP